MQTTIAQQLIIFSFSTSIFLLTLIGAIMCLSIMRLLRLQQLELVSLQADFIPQRAYTPELPPTRELRPPSSQFTPPTQVDIQITPADRTIIETPYKPRPITKRKEKIS